MNHIVAPYITILQVERTNRIIGFNSQFIIDFIVQGISTIFIIAFMILGIRICLLTIKALQIYIKKNS